MMFVFSRGAAQLKQPVNERHETTPRRTTSGCCSHRIASRTITVIIVIIIISTNCLDRLIN